MGGIFGGGKKLSELDKAKRSFETTVNQQGPGFHTEFGFDADGKMVQRFVEDGNQARLTNEREAIALGLGDAGKRIAGSVGQQDNIERDLVADLAGGRDAYERATFERAMNLLGPQLDGQYNSTRSSLVNSGNPIGTERARFELDQLNRNQSAQRTDLALGSVIAGLQGQGQQIGNLNAYSQGRNAADAGKISNAGNIFSVMQADRPNYFVPGQLVGAAQPTKKKSGALGTIGTVAGGVIGGIYGGPAGAAAGASIGGAAGNAVSS